MVQRDLFAPTTTTEILTHLSVLGWDQLGTRHDGLATLHILRRGDVVREVDEDDLGAWLAAGAPAATPADELAVAVVLASKALTRRELAQCLEAAGYDTAGLGRLLGRLVRTGVVRAVEGVYTLGDDDGQDE